jgi:hypothetical protein
MTENRALTDWSGLLPALRETLENAAAPMTTAQLRTGLTGKKKPSAAEIQALLDDELPRGEIHRWPPATGKTLRYWTRSPESVVRPRLLEAVRAADEPISADEIKQRKLVDAPAPLIATLLEELAAQGECRRYEPLKKDQFRYWAGDPDAYQDRLMLQVLEKGKGKTAAPLKWAELAKALKKSLKDVSEDELSQILQRLVDTGVAFKSLRFKPSEPDRYSAKPPDLVEHVREAFGELHKKFAKAGVSAEQVDQAARTLLGIVSHAQSADLPSAVRTVFAELKREKYGHTGLVPIPEVRRAIGGRLGPQAALHEVFDEVIKGLVKSGALNIVPLNDATGVSIDDRNDAIPGTQETWYYLESRS